MSSGAWSVLFPTWVASVRPVLLLGLVSVAVGCGPGAPLNGSVAPQSSEADFRRLMNALADAWNQGDARRAAEFFTLEAIYHDPPDRQIYRGRDELYEFFGGASGRNATMQMQWHHLAFNVETQVGLGEFTFVSGSTAHGVAVVRLRNRRIANWREYWYPSNQPWEQFVARNPF